MIRFKAFKDGEINVTDIVDELRKKISIEDLFIYSDYELVYRSLQQFNFSKLEREEASIEKYAQQVLSAYGFLKNVDRPVEMFAAVFLEKSPRLLQVKNTLESVARHDLAKVQKLIDDYHKIPFIQEYLKKPVNPRNNQENKWLTFYKRTLVKRDEIVQYLLHDILKRAIRKSSSSKLSWGKGMEDWQLEFERADDFPYLEMPYGWSIEYILNMEKLDYNMINPLLNKVNWIDVEKLYGQSYTAEINATIQFRVSKSNFFERLITELESIPVVRERIIIFKEMSELFNQQKWYALYALALPQVEGIFSEVNAMISQKKSSNSLTDKVNFMRSFFEHAHYTFDYYAFTLADLRNSFSHTGKVEDPKTKCFHLLLDIKYLLNIFMELDTPLSKVSKLITEGASKFKDIGDFDRFISELQNVRELGKIDLVLPMARNFVYKELLKQVNVKKMIRLLEQDFIASKTKFSNGLAVLIRDHDFKIFDASISDIQRRLDAISTGYESMAILVSEQWKLMVNSLNVLSSFAVLFPKIPTALKKQMKDFQNKYKKDFEIISFLTAKTKLEVPEDFLLYHRDLVHKIE